MMQQGEKWKFQLTNAKADRVYLVKECLDGISSWLEMAPAPDGHWEAVTTLTPGAYRFNYFTVEGDTFFNGGSVGLTSARIEGDDPHVEVTPASTRYAQLA